MIGTKLFERTMVAADNDDDRDRGELMRFVWEPTPWMIDVNDSEREQEIRNWCNRILGNESSPIHRHVGVWRRGNATINGKTWYGFATSNGMTKFIETFGDICRGVRQ